MPARSPVALVLGLLLVPAAAHAGVAFINAGTKVIGVGCYDVKLADLDGDGRPEVVAAVADGHTVTVVRNDGAGHLGAVTQYPGGEAVAVALRDFTGDGKVDVLSANWTEGTMSFRPNLGTGALGAAVNYAMGTNPRDLVAADFDNDGILDAAVATGSGTITVRPGLGGGAFGALTVIGVGGTLKAIDAADLDHDGLVDLVVVDSQGSWLRPYRNTGAFSFVPGPVTAVATGPSDLKLADLDADGWLDAAIASENQTVSVLRNDLGAFQAPTTYPVGTLSQSIDVADFDVDGIPDLLSSNWLESTVTIVRGLGGMAFQPDAVGTTGTRPRSAAAADFDGDGRPDVVSGDFTAGTVRLLHNVLAFPHAVLSTDHLEFGDGFTGYPDSLALSVTNTGAGTLVFTPGTPDNAEFAVVPSAAVSIPGPGTRTFFVRHRRTLVGEASGTLHVATNDSLAADLVVTLHGTSALSRPRMELNATTLNFGEAFTGVPSTASLTVKNTGSATLVVDAVAPDDPEYTILSPASPFSVAPNATTTMSLRYARSHDGTVDATFHLATNDSLALDVPVALHGVSTPVFPRLDVLTADLDFGTKFTGIPDTLTASFKNLGPALLVVKPGTPTDPQFTVVAPPDSILVPAGATRTLKVAYARSALGPASGALPLASNDTLAVGAQVTLHGVASQPPLAQVTSPAPVTLAAGNQGSGVVRIRNLGASPLQLTVQPAIVNLAETSSLDIGPTAPPFLRADAGGVEWTVAGDGSVQGGSYLHGMGLAGFPAQAGGTLGLGGRELRLGPVAVGGLLLTRKFYVSPEHGWARFVDVAENPGPGTKTWTYDLADSLAYAQVYALRTASGDASFTVADAWIVVPPDDQPGRNAVGRVVRTASLGPQPALAVYGQTALPNSFTRTKYAVSLPAGRRATVVEWAIQASDADAAEAEAQALALSPLAGYEHMDAIDRTTAANVDPVTPVFAIGAGSYAVAPGDSLDLGVTFDASQAWHASEITGALRITSNEPAQPELLVPLMLHVTNGAVVGVERPPAVPARLALAGFRPNPVRPGDRAHVVFTLAGTAKASISLYDVRGRRLARRDIPDPAVGPGALDLGLRLSPGVVWLRLEQGGRAVTTKGIVLP
jgi:hypothetical protein